MSTNSRRRKRAKVEQHCYEAGLGGRTRQSNQELGYVGGYAERSRIRGSQDREERKLLDRVREEHRLLNNARIAAGRL